MTRTVRGIAVFCLGLLLILTCGASIAETRVAKFRLPKSFNKLPPTVISSLVKEGCRIPQTIIKGYLMSTNVITGEFAEKGQKDWAILCSKEGSLYIRLFWGGAIHCPSEIDIGSISEKDIANGFEFDHSIGTAGKRAILQDYQEYGGTKPPTITHLGINYGDEKASEVYYCHDNEWIELTGAD